MKNFNPFAASSDTLDWNKEPVLERRLNNFYDRSNHNIVQAIRPIAHTTNEVENTLGKVLIVDDDEFCLAIVSAPLINMGYDVSVASSYKKSIDQLTNNTFDLVVLDYVLADATGYDVLKKTEDIMGTIYAEGKMPVVTYSTQEQQHIMMPELSIFDYLGHWKKPLKKKELYALMKTL